MMHIEFLVEDSSGKIFLENILPAVIKDPEVSWRVHGYRGIGRIPPSLNGKTDPSKRIILDQLPRLLGGYGKTPYVDAVVVVVDNDDRDCKSFLAELKSISEKSCPNLKVLFRLAIEEMEAWYFGDMEAVKAAYSHVNAATVKAYVQDSICGTWERLADAITPGGSARILAEGWPAPGILKAEWVERIAPHMDIEKNTSPSFVKFRDGIRQLIV
jgi:hypothetical protein